MFLPDGVARPVRRLTGGSEYFRVNRRPVGRQQRYGGIIAAANGNKAVHKVPASFCRLTRHIRLASWTALAAV